MEMRKYSIIGLALLMLSLCACGSKDALPQADDPQAQTGESSSEAEQPEETFSDVQDIFAASFSDDEISVRRQGLRIDVAVLTELPSESQPEDWDSMVNILGSALSQADELASDYDAETVSAQLEAADGTILASGYNGAVQFNLFEPPESSGENSNPPTITQHEFDQISVGMTLTEVREIIGGPGTLETEIGSSGSSVSVLRTYRWEGTGSTLSYATVLFEDYIVYSKNSIGLE